MGTLSFPVARKNKLARFRVYVGGFNLYRDIMVKPKFTIKKIAILWICVIAVALTAGVVYALDSWDTGFKVSNGTTATINLASHSDAACRECKKVTDASGKDIFIPTKSCAEWNAFKANLPAGVTISNCFVCGVDKVYDTEGTPYNTVQIGTQCWMKENIRVGEFMPGDKSGGIYHQANDTKIEKYCWNDNSATCATYGGYYQWHEAVQLPKNCDNIDCSGLISYPRQGICPVGWHIPSDVENTGSPALNNDWYALENFLSPGTCNPDRGDGSFDCGNAGTKMKMGGSSGLELQIIGSIMENGDGWIDMGVDGHYWTSGSTTNTLDNDKRTWGRDFEPGEAGVKRKAKEKNRGFPVRCVKD